jgi:hypothetical protein
MKRKSKIVIEVIVICAAVAIVCINIIESVHSTSEPLVKHHLFFRNKYRKHAEEEIWKSAIADDKTLTEFVTTIMHPEEHNISSH